jgi:hypothetical protein
MHIDTAALSAAITRACAELDRLDAAAAQGEIGLLPGRRRVVLRIEPERGHWRGVEIPLPPGAEQSISAAAPGAGPMGLGEVLRALVDAWDWWAVDPTWRCQSVPADAIEDARAALARLEQGGEPPLPPGAEHSISAAAPAPASPAEATAAWPVWATDDGYWIDADGVRIDVAPLHIGDTWTKRADIKRLTRCIRALGEPAPGAAAEHCACRFTRKHELAPARQIEWCARHAQERDVRRELLAALELILENPDHELLPTERQTAEAAIAKATEEG